MSLLETSLASANGEYERLCNICNSCYSQPRVLSCLHVYCEKCLEKKVTPGKLVLECPECKQETKLTSKGISDLPLDHVLCNQVELAAAEHMQIFCTSCKTSETAVGRCIDCSTYLCPNCVKAHQFMRCFENHQVVSFENMKNCSDDLLFHKPIKCSIHCSELIKYYCHTCQVLICNECIVINHQKPTHEYERVCDIEDKVKDDFQNLITEFKSKFHLYKDTISNLHNLLTDLQMQTDDSKSHIKETYQTYKTILQKCQDDVLKELETLHSTEELKVMDVMQNVEKIVQKIEIASTFANDLLKKGNSVEILSLKKIISTQLLYLINNTPKPEVNTEIKFDTDRVKYEKAIKENFGKLRKPASPINPIESVSSQQTSPIHSSSSFDSDGYTLPLDVTSSSSLSPLDVDLASNVVQYNLAQLAGIAERSSSQGSLNSANVQSPLSDLLIPATEPNITPGRPFMSDMPKLGSLSLNSPGRKLYNPSSLTNLNLENFSQTNISMPRSDSQSAHSISSQITGFLNERNTISPQSNSLLDSSLFNGTTSYLNTSQSGALASSFFMPNVPLLSSQSMFNFPPRSANNKSSPMQIRCKFGQLGPGKGQFSSPHGFCLGMDQEIIVADTNNHRIQIFDKEGKFKYQFGVPGKDEGQLWYPRKIAVIRSDGKCVICDRGSERSRMQIFTTTGHFVRKIAIRYIDIVAGLAVTSENHIVAVDSVSPTVFVIAESGELVRWFDCSTHMREPSDIAVSGDEFYICDFKGHCVVVFTETGNFLRRIGCEGVTNFPNGIDISDAGDILVGDSHGNRFHVVVFTKTGNVVSEYECPYVKVSRCCGLKITSNGYIVTLAKNNHHVLILNTLYVGLS